jgi:REP element-mobilizing transposase RayT
MIHAYHVIWGVYGFWLPNDPRGSWSDFVGAWELARFGRATGAIERREFDSAQWAAWRAAAIKALHFPPVRMDGRQARAAGRGFALGVRKSRLTVWACSILPEHVHLVIARHRYKVEQVCNLLKGEATKRMKAESLHPLQEFRQGDRKLPSVWAEGEWKAYLDTEEAVDEAIHYVEQNPIKEGKPRQKWPFVTLFGGLDLSGWTNYY